MGLEQIFDASSDDHRSLTNMGTWIRPFSFITFNQGYAALLIGQLLPGLLASIFFNVVATFCSRCIDVALYSTITTLLNQFISPSGYSSGDAGTFGTIIILAGLVSSGFAGVLMDRTHAYLTMLKVFWSL
ncbi:unnamed protein product [Rotaria socialis]|uniref:Uncharacterized protein n=1 Tax=Rotaria socialis TaxID=392032 RepID=A0A821E2I7_9BILA|nr:unnamed protein product [Rotaria socialis]CAF4629475.1 unnamed protein product [Rotaria socialis]